MLLSVTLIIIILINGNGGVSVTNSTGSGTVSLTASNSYTGGTTVNGGTLQVGRTNALGASSNALAVNATLDLNGYSVSQGALTGSGTVTSGVASNNTLTVGNGNASSTFSGLITNGSGTVSLTKVGTGTLVLASSQGYTGATNSGAAGTTINAGTVFASNSYVFANNGNGKNVPTINGGGTLIFGATNTTNNLNGGMNWYTAGSYGLNSTQGIAQLIITNGAVVNANAALYIGTGLASAGTASTATNILSVGPGSTLSNSSLIDVGAIGQTVSILTNNGGTITTASVFGVGRGASNTLSAYYQSSGSLTAALGLSFGYNSATNVVGHNATNQFNLNGGTVSVSGIGFNSDGSNNLNQLTIGGGTFTSTGGIGWGGSTNSVYTNPTGTNVIQLNGGLFVENGTYMNASASPAMSNQLNFNGGALQSSTNQAIITNIAVSLQAGGGTIDASNNSINVQAAVSGSGALSVNGLGGTGIVTLSGSNSYNGPTTVRSGTLLVNGTNTASAVTVSNSATIGGTGSAGAVTLNSGSTVTAGQTIATTNAANPLGSLRVSSMVWNAGGNYNWMLQDATGVAGTGYATLSGTGGLDLSSLNSSSPFLINLWTLGNVGGTNGLSANAANFNSSSNYSWTLATFTGGITGFATNNFLINAGATNGTGGFANGLDGGAFSLSSSNNSLFLNFTALSRVTNVWSSTSGNLSTIGITNDSNLVMAGAGGSVTNNSQVTSLSGITFSNTASAYTLSGGSVTSGAAGIVNDSSSAQTVSLGLTLGANQTVNARSGNITLGGDINNAGNTLTLDGTNTTTINGSISGTGALTKIGSGTAVLSASNSFSGTTSVNEGTLQLLNATLTNSSVSVASGATLSGGGSIGNLTNSGSVVLASSDVLTAQAVTLNAGSSLSMSAVSTNAGSFSQLNASSITLNGGVLTFNVVGSYNDSLNQGVFQMFQSGSLNGFTANGGFASVLVNYNGYSDTLTYYSANDTWQVWNKSGDIQNYYAGLNMDTGVLTVVPEPGSVVLFGVGALMAIVVARRRSND